MYKIFSNLLYLFKFMWRLEKSFFYIIISDITINALQPFIMVIFPKLIIDEITKNGDIYKLILLVSIMGVTSFLTRIFKSVIQVFITDSYNKITFALTSELGVKSMGLKFQDVENPEILDLFLQIQRTLNLAGIFSSVTNVISGVISLMGLILIVSTLDYGILVIIIIAVIINVICDGRTKKYDFEWQHEAAPFQRKFNYFTRLMYDFKYGKEIRINNLNEFFKKKYIDEVILYNRKLKIVIYKFFRLNSIKDIVYSMQEFFLYFLLALKAFKGFIGIGDFTMYVSAVSNLTTSLGSVASSFLEIRQQSKFINDFKRFMELPIISDEKLTGNNIEVNLNNNEFVFKFEQVSFRYPNSDKYILKDISLEIKNGEKLSIVGLNGAGKTTLIKLLISFSLSFDCPFVVISSPISGNAKPPLLWLLTEV